jgi:hypothetical protein
VVAFSLVDGSRDVAFFVGAVALGFGEEVATEPEHVRPLPQEPNVLVASEVPRGRDHPAVVGMHGEVFDGAFGADGPVCDLAGAGALRGVLRDVPG